MGIQSALSSLFEAADRGDLSAADAPFSAPYSELHWIAKRGLARRAELTRTDLPFAELADLKFVGGLTFAETAPLRAVSKRTVQWQCDKARIYLH